MSQLNYWWVSLPQVMMSLQVTNITIEIKNTS